jgi:multidrug efflux pump subunit AcrA (membrane-fusion protein)
MELEPVPVGGGEAFGVADRVALDVSARGAELAGIVTLEVVRAPLIRVVRAFGQVVVDETRVRHVHTKVPGTVERLYARFTGQLVRRGQPLLGLYSPDLLSTQQELLRAAEGARRLAVSGSPEAGVAAAGLLASARRRLELYDVPAAWIDRLLERGKPERVVVLGSPVSGVVLEKSTFEGHRVTPDMELLVVADLSQVWVQAALFEHEASSVRVGQPARLRAPASVGPEVRTSVAWVAPVVDPATRTVAVRFELPNPELRLRPGSFADVWLEQDLGEALLVPEGAVVDSGSRRLVYVEVRPGRFAPRVVQLGARADGRVQVLHGLEAGERVASQGTFLLDSEASLRANLARVGHDPRAGHEPHADHVH